MAEIQTAVEALDKTFGDIVAALQDYGLDNDTLVVFTTDHGLALPRAKCTLYDPGLEVALGMALPGQRAREESALCSTIDLAPTLLDLADLPVPQWMTGLSWKKRLVEPEQQPPRRQIFAGMTFHDYYFPCRAVRDERYKLIVHFSNTHAFMDCTQSWYHRSETLTPPNNNRSKSPLFELYDLQKDPWEQRNLADDPTHAEVQQRLLESLAEHIKSTNDPLPQSGFPSPRHQAACKLLNLPQPVLRHG